MNKIIIVLQRLGCSCSSRATARQSWARGSGSSWRGATTSASCCTRTTTGKPPPPRPAPTGPSHSAAALPMCMLQVAGGVTERRRAGVARRCRVVVDSITKIHSDLLRLCISFYIRPAQDREQCIYIYLLFLCNINYAIIVLRLVI